MLARIQPLIAIFRRRPILSLFVFIGLIAFILLLKIRSASNQPSPAEQIFGDLPEINLPSTQFAPPSSTPQTTNLPQTTLKTAPVYQLPQPSEEVLLQFFQPISQEQGFTNKPLSITLNQTPHLMWQNDKNFLTLNLSSGQFTLDLHPQSVEPPSFIISEQKAISIIKDWLTSHNLLQAGFDSTVKKFTTHFNEFAPAQPNDPITAYQISITPKINHLPLTSPDPFEAPISAIVDTAGNIISLYYRLPALTFSPDLSSSFYPLLTNQQINAAIKANQPSIQTISYANGQLAPTTSTISNLSYSSISLGYSPDSKSNYLQPIFILTGTATLEDGTTVQVTAYLSAIAK